ncbi:MAG TPA: hypothetical protein VGE57_11640 [Solimonas sp.]
MDTQLAVRVEGAAPLVTSAEKPLFASEVSFHAIDSRLQLKSDYALRAGELLSPVDAQRWHAWAVPQSLGRQRIGQQAELKLPALAGAPLLVGLRYEQEDLWLRQNVVQSQRQGVDLRWASTLASLQLQWDAEALPWDARNALDCGVRGRLDVPLATPMLALQLGGRQCAVTALALESPSATARTWSAGLRWKEPDSQATLRVLSVDAEPQPQATAAATPPAYELGLDHERRIGAWSARAGVAWRTVTAPAAPATSEQWATDASLRRDLGLMALSAQWQNGDRYWFVPGVAAPTDDLALSLDMSRWAALRWPGYAPTMALSYRWQRSATGASAAFEDESVQWRMSLPWR